MIDCSFAICFALPFQMESNAFFLPFVHRKLDCIRSDGLCDALVNLGRHHEGSVGVFVGFWVGLAVVVVPALVIVGLIRDLRGSLVPVSASTVLVEYLLDVLADADDLGVASEHLD